MVAAGLAAAKKSVEDKLAELGASIDGVFEVVSDAKVVLITGSTVGGISIANNVAQIYDRPGTSLHYRTMEARVSSIERMVKKPRDEYISIAIVIAPPKANGDQDPLILSAQRSLGDESMIRL